MAKVFNKSILNYLRETQSKKTAGSQATNTLNDNDYSSRNKSAQSESMKRTSNGQKTSLASSGFSAPSGHSTVFATPLSFQQDTNAYSQKSSCQKSKANVSKNSSFKTKASGKSQLSSTAPQICSFVPPVSEKTCSVTPTHLDMNATGDSDWIKGNEMVPINTTVPPPCVYPPQRCMVLSDHHFQPKNVNLMRGILGPYPDETILAALDTILYMLGMSIGMKVAEKDFYEEKLYDDDETDSSDGEDCIQLQNYDLEDDKQLEHTSDEETEEECEDE